MSAISRVALVAKPWRGGLASYAAMALEEKFPGHVCCVHTYPTTARDKIAYRLDKRAWRMRLIDKIQLLEADVVLFINLLPEFSSLPGKPEYVAWLTDNPSPVLDLLGPFGHVFVSDPGYAEHVRLVVGERRFAGVLPFACHPEFHKAAPRTEKEQGFCFIANRDAKRDQVLRYLFAHNRNVHVYGNYFMRHRLFWRHPFDFGPSVDNAQMANIYARHLASLNIHADVVIEGTNMRTFECAAYGIPQLVEYRPGIEEYFSLSDELYVYRDNSELVDLMSRIEANPNEARARAVRAHDHALSEHTYQRRVEQILHAL